MKEAIGGTSLFVIVLVILSVFAIYISISVNWSTAYKVKDEIIFYIEKNKGLNDNSIGEINKYLADVGYFNIGKCPSSKGWNAFRVGQKSNVTIALDKANYCVAKVNYIKNTADMSGKTDDWSRGLTRSYYSVRTFFLLDLPVIRKMGLTIDGESKVIINPRDKKGIKSVSVKKVGGWD